MRETIAISDTNIFIDLLSVSLLDAFLTLPLDIRTTDFVVNEIRDGGQAADIHRHIGRGEITVVSFTMDELNELYEFHSTNSSRTNVSLPDCSVWLYAIKNDCTLLTGDAKLRKSAIQSGTNVRGILYIFDRLVSCNVIDGNTAARKLEELYAINNRLPRNEIEKRIADWTT